MLVSCLFVSFQVEEAEMLAAEVETYREKFTKTYKERASLEASLIDARG